VVTIRRLGLGDEAVIATLAKEEAAFDIEGRGHPRASIGEAAAAEYLADEQVLHWVGEEAGTVVGHLLCYVQRRRASDPLQLMLYEIGVRKNYRRQGVGRALIGEMEEWMTENRVSSVWVLADNDVAEAFYTACGFSRDDPQPVQMSRRL
jgi:ribosomal protein S18 acetylase RimI-like enzyme